MTKKTKIVATIGPASEKKETLRKMIEAGMNVARINFSHGTHDSNGKAIDTLKELRDEMEVSLGIMADLQGPRIRTVTDGDVFVQKGEIIRVYDLSGNGKNMDDAERSIGLDCENLIGDIGEGNDILIQDGLMRLRVIEKRTEYLRAEVIEGGTIKNHKGVNVPDARITIPVVTQKDAKDLKFSLSKGVDFVALSFVSTAEEIREVRSKMAKILKREGNLPGIVAKIERKEAIKNIDEIIAETDVIMVARGDLGIELDESKVVIYQKEIINKCLRAACPVIVATQMLESMIENPLPTRAEVSDVSNAVIDHADAVMLSGESANGKFPTEAVRTMANIILRTEESPFDNLEHGFLGDAKSSVSAAVANAAHDLAKDAGARAIVVASMTGYTARMMARHRPEQAIYVVTNSERSHDQLSILWGTESFILPDCETLDRLITESIKTLVRNKKLEKKDRVVVVTGRPHVKREHMSLVKVEEVK